MTCTTVPGAADSGAVNLLVRALEDASTVSVAGLDDSTVLQVAGLSRQLVAVATAIQLKALAEFAAQRPAEGREFDPSAADEVAMELSLTTSQATGAMYHSCTLTRRLPAVLEALESGTISPQVALILDRKTAALSDDLARAAVDQVLPQVHGLTSAQVSRRITRAVLKVDPEGAKARHEVAKADRRVEFVPQDDGMCELVARLSADVGAAIHARVDHLARVAKAPDDTRTLDAVRADVFADLLLGRPVTGEGPKVEVRVTIPATALAGGNQPAELEGYGPIHPGLARRLAASPNAILRRMVTDPLKGTLVHRDRKTYRPSKVLADHVRARDDTCTFPGCEKTVGDLDHTIPYPKGPTSADNLRLLCRRHHLTKQTMGWTVQQHGDQIVWTTPTGRTYARGPVPLSEPEAGDD